MVIKLRKKANKPARPLSAMIEGPNQLLEPVSPFDEILSDNNSVSFQKSYNFHRRHSYAREQLAKLKAKHCLDASTAGDSETRNDTLTGLSTTPARTAPETSASFLSKPRKLTKSSKSNPETHHKSSFGRNYLTSFRPPMIPPQIFASNGCDLPMAGTCATMPLPSTAADYEIPFIISITKLDDDDDDDVQDDERSEISLEDAIMFKSSSGTTTTNTAPTMSNSNSYSQSYTTVTPPSLASWTNPVLAGMTKPCMMPMRITDLVSMTDSSISWPSDEEQDDDDDDDDDETCTYEADEEENGEAVSERESNQQLITVMHDLNCYDDGSSHYFKPDMVCGSFKFWSMGDMHNSDLVKNEANSNESTTSARDEENCCTNSVDEKARREEVPENRSNTGEDFAENVIPATAASV